MLAAVAPATDVDALDVADREDRALDADDERPELRLSLRREPLEIAVLTRVEEKQLDRGSGATSQCSSLQIASPSPVVQRRQSTPPWP